jgi:beta-N-acetylhexosaminidase
VRGTLKHFPGLGRVERDTHLHPARLSETPAELAADWLPFRSLAGHAGSALMLGHVTLEALDPQRAASHSPTVIRLLRSDWGYDGVLVTDDLNMGAVYNLGIGKVAAEALAAGVDLILVSYDPRQVYRALHGAAIALSSGELPAETLAGSAKRLTHLVTDAERAPRFD